MHTLNCVGYDHNWVKQYLYAPGHEPLLPKGTVVRYVGYLDTTDDNRTWPTIETGKEAAGAQWRICSSSWVGWSA